MEEKRLFFKKPSPLSLSTFHDRKSVFPIIKIDTLFIPGIPESLTDMVDAKTLSWIKRQSTLALIELLHQITDNVSEPYSKMSFFYKRMRNPNAIFANPMKRYEYTGKEVGHSYS